MKAVITSAIGGLVGLLIGLMMLNPVEYLVLPIFPLFGIVVGLIAARWPTVGASLVGAVVGCGIGVLLTLHVDAILPVVPLCGFVVGLIAGPSLLAVVRRWKRK